MDDGFGLADMIVLAVIHGAVQHAGAVIVERIRGRDDSMEHPLDEPLRAIAFQLQEALPAIKEALQRKGPRR
jgi:hypothetical protein